MRKRMFESIDPHLTIAVRAMANRVSLRKGIGYISIDDVDGEHVGNPNRMDKDCLISFDMSFVVYSTHKNVPKLSPDRSKINLHVDIAPYEGIDAYWRDSNLVLHKSINLVDTVRADAKLTTLESCILEAMYIVLDYGEHKNWGEPYSVTYSYNSTRSESYSKRVDEGTSRVYYWLDKFSNHDGLVEIINSCTDKEKEELNDAISEIMNAADDLKEGHSLSAFLDCLLAGDSMKKLANKLSRKQVWYRWH